LYIDECVHTFCYGLQLTHMMSRLRVCVYVKSKVEMFSKYERQKDKRSYGDRLQLFTGPQFVSPVERIKPQKVIHWNEEGLPVYADDDPASSDLIDNSTVEGVA